MTKSNRTNKGGRPATGKDPLISARVPPATVDAIDTWAAKNSATRSEAIRQLIELGLTVKTATSGGRANRAAELAAEAIDKIGDPAAPPEELAERGRRLTKGPEEFREVRVDRAKK